jgi:hypothetical protein
MSDPQRPDDEEETKRWHALNLPEGVTEKFEEYVGTSPGDKIGERIIDRVKRWHEAIVGTGLYAQWVENWRMFHNMSPSGGGGSSFALAGDNSEILQIRINEMRNLLTHMLNLTFAKPPALRAIAENASADSMEGAQAADALLQEDFQGKRGGRVMRSAGTWALAVCGTSFIHPEWDLFAGEPYIPTAEGSMVYSGAPRLRARSAMHVVFDLSKWAWEDVESTIVIDRANKYVLASQFSDQADAILKQRAWHENQLHSAMFVDAGSDDIIVYKYLHRPVNSLLLPSGRYTMVLEDGTVLRDDDSPYSQLRDQRIGLFPVTAAEQLGSALGYASSNDLAPPQKLTNLCATIMATTVAGFGAPVIAGPPLEALNVAQLVGGMKYLGMGGGQLPQVLDLLPKSDYLPGVLEAAKRFGETLSGMNAIVRGDASADQMSGKAIAQIQSMAIQFMSMFQASVIDAHEDCGDYLIQMRQALSTGDQKVAVVGTDNVQQTIDWNAEKLKSVARIRAEAVDPMLQTSQGRDERARFMVENGMTEMPQEYVLAAETGQYKPIFRATTSQLTLIHRENEELRKGEAPIFLDSDKHEWHAPEHLAILADPTIRQNPELVANVLNHTAMHLMAQAGLVVDQSEGAPPAWAQWKEAEAMSQSMAPPPAPGAASMTPPPEGEAPEEAPQGAPASTPLDAMQALPS